MEIFMKYLARCCAVTFFMASLLLSGCAIGPRTSYHTFSFDGWNDKWATTVDLLEYDYGAAHSMVSRKAESAAKGLGYSTSINAPMPNGEYLFVKWRIKGTTEVLESRVDLRGRLPENMIGHKITFVIDGRQLLVFLITPKEKKYMTPPILKTALSKFYESYEIYPNNTFNK